MELTRRESQMLKGLAILAMVVLHLFQVRDYQGIFTPLATVGGESLVFWFALLADFCVPIYCFCAGYAHALLLEKDGKRYIPNSAMRVLKFLLNYWIVLCLISLAVLLLGRAKAFGLRPSSFLKDFFLLSCNFNGAWWFVATYVLLVALSPIVLRLLRRMPWWLSVALFGAIYVAAYLIRFQKIPLFELQTWRWDGFWLSRQAVLLGTSLFPYVTGVAFFQQKWFSRWRGYLDEFDRPRLVRALSVVVFALLLIGHGLVPSLIIAPITGIVAICAFVLPRRGKVVEAIFVFLGEHSTNIWLTHMFFYIAPFAGLVYLAKYPPLVLLFMLALTIGSSYVIGVAHKASVKLIDKAAGAKKE